MVNVGKHTIHGSSGPKSWFRFAAGIPPACLFMPTNGSWCLPLDPKTIKNKGFKPQYMAFNPLKMKVVGSHASHDLLFEFWLVG